MQRPKEYGLPKGANIKKPRAASYFPSLRGEIDFTNANIHMFVEDVQLTVMPIGGRSHFASDFSAEIRGSCECENNAIVLLESLAGHDRHDPTELLSDVIGRIAQELARSGRAVHEIVRDKDTGKACVLRGFTSQRLFHVFGRYIQMIPKADRKLWKKSCVIIPEKDIWEIVMPRVLGGYRGHRAMLRQLARFQHIGPSFLMQELNRQGWPVDYDVQRYTRETEFFESKITSLWGWNRRDYGDRNWTEFYLFYRILQFRWAQACLREHIVDELNRLFRRSDIEAKIVVKGLPTASDILAVRQRMLDGDISFKDASDACSV